MTKQESHISFKKICIRLVKNKIMFIIPTYLCAYMLTFLSNDFMIYEIYHNKYEITSSDTILGTKTKGYLVGNRAFAKQSVIAYYVNRINI